MGSLARPFLRQTTHIGRWGHLDKQAEGHFQSPRERKVQRQAAYRHLEILDCLLWLIAGGGSGRCLPQAGLAQLSLLGMFALVVQLGQGRQASAMCSHALYWLTLMIDHAPSIPHYTGDCSLAVTDVDLWWVVLLTVWLATASMDHGVPQFGGRS